MKVMLIFVLKGFILYLAWTFHRKWPPTRHILPDLLEVLLFYISKAQRHVGTRKKIARGIDMGPTTSSKATKLSLAQHVWESGNSRTIWPILPSMKSFKSLFVLGQNRILTSGPSSYSDDFIERYSGTPDLKQSKKHPLGYQCSSVK